MTVMTLQTDWWTLDLPDEWHASQHENLVIIVDEDELSCIEITTLQREDRDVTPGDLTELSAELRDRGLMPEIATLGPWRGDYFHYVEDGEVCREWYLGYRRTLLFITCSCLQEHARLDDAAVDAILQTLAPSTAEC